MEVKQYLDYLDKEMTIMGILSAAAVAAPAGVLNFSLSKDARDLLWVPGHYFIVMGSTLCILAALLFYKERSFLAWYYGQISLAAAITSEQSADAKLREWLLDADSWETWWPYFCAFTCLIAGMAEFSFAAFFLLAPTRWSFLHAHLGLFKRTAFLAGPVVVAIITPMQRYVRTHYKFNEEPWSDFRSDLFGWLMRKSLSPHEGVYARLKPSMTHGVGVFALIDIPRGAYVFEPDDGATATIRKKEADKSDAVFRELYEDFCVLRGDNYICPSNFNQLTISWYLNHSTDPNVAPDSSLKFYALRKIHAGEELTSNYHAYSDAGPRSQSNPSSS